MLRKKSIFFTFISITIMAVFILVFTPQADISLQKDSQAIRVRISTIDNYVNDLENRYFETVLRATMHKAILSLTSYVSANSPFGTMDEFNSAFSKVMSDGTINGNTAAEMGGETLNYWKDEIIRIARDTLNVDTAISFSTVSQNPTVFQRSAWNIESAMTISFTVKAKDNVAEWKKDNIQIRTNISIEGFEDPLYLVKTGGQYHNTIKKSSVDFKEWNVPNVNSHISKGEYVHWGDLNEPEFLRRFTNEPPTPSASDCCGIESFVNPNKLASSGLPRDQTEIYVDHLFWNPTSNPTCSELYTINGLTGDAGGNFDWFKLDVTYLVRYKLEGNDENGNKIAQKAC